MSGGDDYTHCIYQQPTAARVAPSLRTIVLSGMNLDDILHSYPSLVQLAVREVDSRLLRLL
ncbi:hypothetical protein [Synechococcus sp. M16CYN]|uniref:hypothetical protein n=1 Tax=Synechococcus sp. M16CYN TaxID=3103139 RepID=UPI00333F1BDF